MSVVPAQRPEQRVLKVFILNLLREASSAYTIHGLIEHLQQHAELSALFERHGLTDLFRINFLVMNALFQLQDELRNENLWLDISSLHIALATMQSEQTVLPASQVGSEKLREFYLDWSNCESVTDSEVQGLLDDFWQFYYRQDKQRSACEVLGVAPDIEEGELRQVYRRLAQQHHPDRGGDARDFIRIREAYELLRY